MVTVVQTLPKTNAGAFAAGPKRRSRRGYSRFGTQLKEKQNLKGIYGISEEQLRRYFREARNQKVETGPALVSLLEQRLDNAVFRAGFAVTRKQARQMATHRLFTVNERAVDVPSYRLTREDVVHIKESKRKKSYFTNFSKRMQNAQPPSWITLDTEHFGFKVTGIPAAEEAAVGVDMQAIVELLAR